MSSRIKRWTARVALALPIMMSAGLSLWFTRPTTPQPRRLAAEAAEAEIAAAAEPTANAVPETSVVGAATSSGPTRDESPEAFMRRRRVEMLATQPASTISDTEAAEAMLREHAPHMWSRLQHMPYDAPMRARLERQMMERARDLQRMQLRDAEQFKNEVEQLKLEDEVADLGRRVGRRADASSAESEALRTTIKKLVDVRIRNREARLARLANTLASEKEKLQADRDNRDKLVERQFQAVVNRRPFGGGGGAPREGRPALASPPGPRRGPGGPRGEGGGPQPDVQASPDRSPDNNIAK
jgi:hypothetical protein